jgi:photosystem II stability/assembly factor-like uncharacterized protein
MANHRMTGIAAFVALALSGCASPVVHPRNTATIVPEASPTPAPPSPSPSPALPTGFQPRALSAISDSVFWVLGTDQCATTNCPPEILRTSDAGRTFHRIPSPPMVFLYGNPSTPGLPRVFDIRFADASDGWVFGDQLWATHDGGEHWRQINLGFTVDQLEPGANGYVYAAFEDCSALGSPCVYRLMRSQARSDAWSKIAPPASPAGRPVIGVHGDTLWVMYFNGSPRLAWISHDDGRLWVRGSMPCTPELGGSFDPVSNSVIWAFCATGNFGDPWVSTNGGVAFSSSPTLQGVSTNGASVAALSAQHAFIVDPGAGMLRVTTNGGRTFQAVPQLAGAQWAGFTDSEVGYVIAAGQPNGSLRLWRTADAGRIWSLISLP